MTNETMAVRSENCFITGHAIDRASLRCYCQWTIGRKKDEGIHAWLARGVNSCMQMERKHEGDRYEWSGVILVIKRFHKLPTLVTVIPQPIRQYTDMTRITGSKQYA